jgi:hypothetical protein
MVFPRGKDEKHETGNSVTGAARLANVTVQAHMGTV